ncbi:ATP-binding protein [Brevibacterium yomogidense]|nr:ATP-binding protein [Brevibacterium yomogidense]
MIDRLVHQAEVQPLDGESYRTRTHREPLPGTDR